MPTGQRKDEWRDIHDAAGRVSKITALGTSGIALVVGVILLAAVIAALLWG
jgi:hypothetical protein